MSTFFIRSTAFSVKKKEIYEEIEHAPQENTLMHRFADLLITGCEK
jgi:predicted peroxiredoxin